MLTNFDKNNSYFGNDKAIFIKEKIFSFGDLTGYTQVDYIKKTNSASKLETNILLSDKGHWNFVFNTNVNQNNDYLMSAGNASGVFHQFSGIRVHYWQNNITIFTSTRITTIDFNKLTLSATDGINNYLYIIIDRTIAPTKLNLCLGSTENKHRTFYYDNPSGVREICLIPCYRNSDNICGFYDTVTKSFMTDTTGNNGFSGGND